MADNNLLAAAAGLFSGLTEGAISGVEFTQKLKELAGKAKLMEAEVEAKRATTTSELAQAEHYKSQAGIEKVKGQREEAMFQEGQQPISPEEAMQLNIPKGTKRIHVQGMQESRKRQGEINKLQAETELAKAHAQHFATGNVKEHDPIKLMKDASGLANDMVGKLNDLSPGAQTEKWWSAYRQNLKDFEGQTGVRFIQLEQLENQDMQAVIEGLAQTKSHDEFNEKIDVMKKNKRFAPAMLEFIRAQALMLRSGMSEPTEPMTRGTLPTPIRGRMETPSPTMSERLRTMTPQITGTSQSR